MAKAHLKLRFIVVIKPSLHFCEDSSPLFLFSWKNSEDRFQSLTIKFTLETII
jgi:hypothetical protein